MDLKIEHLSECSIRAQWVSVGSVSLSPQQHRVVMPPDLPNVSGIYRIEATGVREIYVGEGAYLTRRLRNYENAGWSPGIKSHTNRFVQGWIHGCLTSDPSTVQVFICTSAQLEVAGDIAQDLDLRQKYFRVLVEAATVASLSGWKIKNKQYVAELSRVESTVSHAKGPSNWTRARC